MNQKMNLDNICQDCIHADEVRCPGFDSDTIKYASEIDSSLTFTEEGGFVIDCPNFDRHPLIKESSKKFAGGEMSESNENDAQARHEEILKSKREAIDFTFRDAINTLKIAELIYSAMLIERQLDDWYKEGCPVKADIQTKEMEGK